MTTFLLWVIFVALMFDFNNGFHDTANSIATIITTGVLSTRQAVVGTAFFNFATFFIFELTERIL